MISEVLKNIFMACKDYGIDLHVSFSDKIRWHLFSKSDSSAEIVRALLGLSLEDKNEVEIGLLAKCSKRKLGKILSILKRVLQDRRLLEVHSDGPEKISYYRTQVEIIFKRHRPRLNQKTGSSSSSSPVGESLQPDDRFASNPNIKKGWIRKENIKNTREDKK